jgi:hypothetical protein
MGLDWVEQSSVALHCFGLISLEDFLVLFDSHIIYYSYYRSFVSA